jgi:DNA invertase Pin-like site-specific DNA recombinase
VKPTREPLRAALYARVSTDDDRQDPGVQLEQLRLYAEAKGWHPIGYTDRASARDLRARVQWRQLLEDVRRGRVDMVVVWKLDRAFRSTLEALRGLELFQHEGVGFICLTQPIDTTSSSGRLLFTVLAAVAEIERDLISERTRAGLARARAQGKRIGRPPGAKDGKRRRRRARPAA